jgi:hypothetical protein|tara:strand:- start:6583 stop:6855 length:273 start_codon:yes stop_codon:yes gene_type:complete
MEKRIDLIRAFAKSQHKDVLGVAYTKRMANHICPEGIVNTPLPKLERLINELRKEWSRRVGVERQVTEQRTDDIRTPKIFQTRIFQELDE